MRFFKEIEPAEVCYLAEVAEWIVRGAVPEIVTDDRGLEVRGNLHAFLNEFEVYDALLHPAELEHFSDGLSYSEYLDAVYGIVEEINGNNPDPEYPLMEVLSNSNEEERSNALVKYIQARENVARQKADELLTERLADFRHDVERARLEVAAAAVSGALPIQGFWIPEGANLYDEAEKLTLTARPVPPEHIRPDCIDWNGNTIKVLGRRGIDAGCFHLVTTRTATALQLFPMRHGEERKSIFYNAFVIVDEEIDRSEPHSSARRGRPPKTPWLREAIRARYLVERAKGKVGNGKKDADFAAAQGWAAELGFSIARTTAQAYLGDLTRGSADK